MAEFEPEVIQDERGRGKFRDNKKTDAEWAGLRVAPHIPAHQAHNRLKLPILEGFVEAVREGFRQEASSRACTTRSFAQVRSSGEAETVVLLLN